MLRSTISGRIEFWQKLKKWYKIEIQAASEEEKSDKDELAGTNSGIISSHNNYGKKNMLQTINKSLITITAFSMLLASTASNSAPRIIPKAPTVIASSHILIDFDSGKVITEFNQKEHLAPASLTKIMTSYAVFSELKQGHIQLSDEVTISKKAWQTGGSKMFIEVGKKISVEKLLKGMIISSGNDASVALAEHIGGAEETFAELMNQYAEILGMHNSNFQNATGMPASNHYSSAEDMAILAQALIRDFPEFYKIYSEREFIFGKELKSGKPIKQSNRNKLLWLDDSVDGLKTGYTKAAGYCLVASAKKDGMRLISAVFGADSVEARARESQKLLNFGFRFYETEPVTEPGKTLSTLRVWKGDKTEIRAGVVAQKIMTLGRNQFKDIKSEITLTNELLEAPISEGDVIGSVSYSVDGAEIYSAPLVALESVESGSIWNNLIDSVKLWFE